VFSNIACTLAIPLSKRFGQSHNHRIPLEDAPC